MAKNCVICNRINQNPLLKTCSYACNKKYLELNPKKEKTRKPIAQISDKRATQFVVYKLKKKRFLKKWPNCKKCLYVEATEIHHRNGREGERLNDEIYFMGVCRVCHTWIHEHPEASRKKGWLI